MFICLVLTAVIFAGCGKKNDSGQPQAAKQVQKGGQLVYGSLQEPNSLNPLLSDLMATAEIGRLVFSGLLTNDEKGQWVPDLAMEVPTRQNGGVSSDGLAITYRLRPGVTWHDGVPFSAQDVKFTWNLIMNGQNKVVIQEGYNQIAAIDTPDNQTVIIRFKEYYAPYLTLFSTILPKHILEGSPDISKSSFNRNPIGTGPFKLKDWKIAESITFEANSAYFLGRPTLDTILYKIIPDTNILITQLKSGDIDLVNNIVPTQLDQVKAIANVRTVITPGMVWEHLDFNLDNSLFQDVRVRQAIQLAIDRPAIVSAALRNVGGVALTDQPPFSWAYNSSIKAAGRDINGARELLTQAGWVPGADGIFAKDGRKLAFTLVTTSGNKMREAVAQQLVQQMKEAGIFLQVQYADVPGFFADVLKNRRFEAAMYAWVAGIDPENSRLWHSKAIPGRSNGYDGQNYGGWRNPEIDKLTEMGKMTVDTEQRQQIYFRIQEIMVQEVPVVPLYYRATIDVVKNNIANYRPNPTPAGNFWNAWQWGLMK